MHAFGKRIKYFYIKCIKYSKIKYYDINYKSSDIFCFFVSSINVAHISRMYRKSRVDKTIIICEYIDRARHEYRLKEEHSKNPFKHANLSFFTI